MSTSGAGGEREELRILDDRGCLTSEAAVLSDQLLPEQRAVVERHVRSCTVCAQQHTGLARATERFRRARPRLQLPAEVRQIARQIALRGLAHRRARPAATTARVRAVKGRLRYSDLGRRWYRSRSFWIATLTGLGTALLLSVVALLVLSCKPEEKLAAPAFSVELGAERVLAELKVRVSAGAAGPGELIAAGTEQGAVLLVSGAADPALGETALHDGPISALAFSRDGRHLLSAGGKLCAWWSTASRTLVRQVHGPQLITSALLLERSGGPRVYFGTDHGALVRWDPSQPKAEPLPDLACPAGAPSPAQLAAPVEKRCPYGRFVPEARSAGICAYPVTAIAAAGSTLAWACREGGLRMLELVQNRRDGFSPGWLKTLTALPTGQVLAGRGEGQLRVYALAEKKLLRELQPAGAPEAAASDGDLLAVAQAGAVRIWVGEAPRAVASLPSEGRVVWLGLRRTGGKVELRQLLADGRLILRTLLPRPLARRAP